MRGRGDGPGGRGNVQVDLMYQHRTSVDERQTKMTERVHMSMIMKTKTRMGYRFADESYGFIIQDAPKHHEDIMTNEVWLVLRYLKIRYYQRKACRNIIKCRTCLVNPHMQMAYKDDHQSALK